MPKLNPNKAYAYEAPPPPDLEEKALPENWLEQLGDSTSAALQLSEDDKVQFLADLQRHAGVDATYKLKPHLQTSLKAIYSRLLNPHLSSDQKMSLAFKLHEGARNCTSGLHIRANTIVRGFERPKDFAALVQHLRQETVDQIASQNTHEVHAHNRFFVVANILGYGVTPLNPGDTWTGETSDGHIKRQLDAAFSKKFQFFALLNALQSSIKPFLVEDEYTGKKATGEYSFGEYDKFGKTLKSFITIKDQDLYVMDDEDHIIDIHWPKVKAAFLKKLTEENYFHLTSAEEQELRLFNLDDINAEEPLEEKEGSSPSRLCMDDNELLHCVTYFKDWPHQGGLTQLIKNNLAGKTLPDKKKTISLLEKIPDLKDQPLVEQCHVDLAAFEGNHKEIFQKIKKWARIGCNLYPVFPLLLNTIKGRRLLLEDENIQRLFPKTGVKGKSLDAWLLQAGVEAYKEEAEEAWDRAALTLTKSGPLTLTKSGLFAYPTSIPGSTQYNMSFKEEQRNLKGKFLNISL